MKFHYLNLKLEEVLAMFNLSWTTYLLSMLLFAACSNGESRKSGTTPSPQSAELPTADSTPASELKSATTRRVASDEISTCMIKGQSKIVCWGDNSFVYNDKIFFSEDFSDVSDIAISRDYRDVKICAVVENKPRCWHRSSNSSSFYEIEAFSEVRSADAIRVSLYDICLVENRVLKCFRNKSGLPGQSNWKPVKFMRDFKNVSRIEMAGDGVVFVYNDEGLLWASTDNLSRFGSYADPSVGIVDFGVYFGSICYSARDGLTCARKKIVSYSEGMVPKEVSLNFDQVCVAFENQVRCWKYDGQEMPRYTANVSLSDFTNGSPDPLFEGESAQDYYYFCGYENITKQHECFGAEGKKLVIP